MKFYFLPFFSNPPMTPDPKFRIHRDEEFNEIEFQPLIGKKTFFPIWWWMKNLVGNFNSDFMMAGYQQNISE
jgi:hypothetical protein